MSFLSLLRRFSSANISDKVLDFVLGQGQESNLIALLELLEKRIHTEFSIWEIVLFFLEFVHTSI